MKALAILLATVLASATPCRAQQPGSIPANTRTLSKDNIPDDVIQRALDDFRKDPFEALHKGEDATIISYAPEIAKFSDFFLQWSGKDVASEQEKHLLRVAYTAAILARRRDLRPSNHDPFYLVLLQVIDTYDQLKKADPKLHSDTVEDFISKDKAGTLEKACEPMPICNGPPQAKP